MCPIGSYTDKRVLVTLAAATLIFQVDVEIVAPKKLTKEHLSKLGTFDSTFVRTSVRILPLVLSEFCLTPFQHLITARYGLHVIRLFEAFRGFSGLFGVGNL